MQGAGLGQPGSLPKPRGLTLTTENVFTPSPPRGTSLIWWGASALPSYPDLGNSASAPRTEASKAILMIPQALQQYPQNTVRVASASPPNRQSLGFRGHLNHLGVLLKCRL